MKREEIEPIGADAVENLRFLLFDPTGGNADPPWPEEEWAASPIQCLDKAVEWKPEIVVISFGPISLREREVLVELSAALKRNSHTKQCTLLALLYLMHRELIEDLENAKVDYVRHIGEAKLDSRLVRGIIEDVGRGDRLDRHLAALCPFLHYSWIDSQQEITVCRANLDRLVLGGRRLRGICETKTHFRCEYYRHPRLKS